MATMATVIGLDQTPRVAIVAEIEEILTFLLWDGIPFILGIHLRNYIRRIYLEEVSLSV